jgi:hypothetical protein
MLGVCVGGCVLSVTSAAAVTEKVAHWQAHTIWVQHRMSGDSLHSVIGVLLGAGDQSNAVKRQEQQQQQQTTWAAAQAQTCCILLIARCLT